MTPTELHSAYRSCADQVSVSTGIDPIALLSQWANETAWGTVVVGNNLGNIRCSPTSFCRYATLDDFAQACIVTYHNGYYAAVLAATNATDQLAAICASPWSAGHYGGSLDAYYQPLEEFELTPEQEQRQIDIFNGVQAINYALFYGRGTPNTPPPGTEYASTDLDGKLDAAVKPVLDAIAKLPGGGTESPEPAEPSKGTLHVPAQDIPITFP